MPKVIFERSKLVLKPKPLYCKTNHSYLDSNGQKWLTTAKPGSPLRPGCKWVKEKSFCYELFKGSKEEKPFVIQDVCVEEITEKQALEIAKWFISVSKWLKKKGV